MTTDSALQGFSLQMALLATWSIVWLTHHARQSFVSEARAFHATALAFQALNLAASATKWLLTHEVAAAAMPLKMVSNSAVMAGIAVLAHLASRRQPALEAIRLHSALLAGFDLAAATAWAIVLA